MLIRTETAADRDVVHELNVAAFGTPAEADLVDTLREVAQPLISMVAEEDERIIEDLEQDRYVRKEVAKALGKLGDPKAGEPLIRALEDKDKQVRAEAAEALGALRDPRAIGPMVHVIRT